MFYDVSLTFTLMLTRHVLRCLLDVHVRVDAFATYNEMIRGYTGNLIIRRTLVIKYILFFRDNLEVHVPNKRGLRYLTRTMQGINGASLKE